MLSNHPGTAENRRLVFLSHANPQDNEFTRWLGVRLANSGYLVWSDVTKLLGGEDFWKDAETAIRDGAAKVLYVLSKTSNSKEGPLRELAIAQKVAKEKGFKDFVIPLHIDDLRHEHINIELTRLNATEFNNGWAPGLSALLEKLQKDGVPRDISSGYKNVREWWSSNVDGARIVSREPETYLSNWYSLELPDQLRLLNVGRGIVTTSQLHFPAVQYENYVFTFASPSDLSLSYARTNTTLTEVALQPDDKEAHVPLVEQSARLKAISNLINQAWLKLLVARGLPIHDLSGRRHCGYFTEDVVNSRVKFKHPDGYSGSRALHGEATAWSARTQSAVTRHWHYAISADPRLRPKPLLKLNSHVLFSDEGKTIWSSKSKLHSARRKQCKNWWNAHWLDRMLSATEWLSAGNEHIEMRVASDAVIRMAKMPISFLSPASYSDEAANRFEDIDDEDDEDEIVSSTNEA